MINLLKIGRVKGLEVKRRIIFKKSIFFCNFTDTKKDINN